MSQEILPPEPDLEVIDRFMRGRPLPDMIINLMNDWQRANKASDIETLKGVAQVLIRTGASEPRPAVRQHFTEKFCREFKEAVEIMASRKFADAEPAGRG